MKRASTEVFEHVSHALLVLCFLAATLWYLNDAIEASKRIENLIFVVPVAAVTVVLAIYVLGRLAVKIRGALRRRPATSERLDSGVAEHDGAAPSPRDFLTRWRAPLVAILFTLYVATMNIIGFDVASFLFIAGCLVVQGERNPLVFIGYPLVFAALITHAFRLMVPYPFFTVFV